MKCLTRINKKNIVNAIMSLTKEIFSPKFWWIQFVVLLLSSQLRAQTSTTYIQKSSAFSSGSGSVQSTSYKLHGTLGQSFNGSSSSTSFSLKVGFESNLINQSYDLTLSNLTLNPSSVVRGNDITAFFTVRSNVCPITSGSEPNTRCQ